MATPMHGSNKLRKYEQNGDRVFDDAGPSVITMTSGGSRSIVDIFRMTFDGVKTSNDDVR